MNRLNELLQARAQVRAQWKETDELLARAFYAEQISQDEVVQMGAFGHRSSMSRACAARYQIWSDQDKLRAIRAARRACLLSGQTIDPAQPPEWGSGATGDDE